MFMWKKYFIISFFYQKALAFECIFCCLCYFNIALFPFYFVEFKFCNSFVIITSRALHVLLQTCVFFIVFEHTWKMYTRHPNHQRDSTFSTYDMKSFRYHVRISRNKWSFRNVNSFWWFSNNRQNKKREKKSIETTADKYYFFLRVWNFLDYPFRCR